MTKNYGRPPEQGTGRANSPLPPSNIPSAADTGDARTNIRAMERLVNTYGAQRDEVENARARAFEEGYRLGFDSGDEVGYGRAMHEVDQGWAEVAARSHFLGSPLSRTYAEKRAAELEACVPRPGDFPGLENDPQCLEPIRASVEALAHNHNQRAA